MTKPDDHAPRADPDDDPTERTTDVPAPTDPPVDDDPTLEQRTEVEDHERDDHRGLRGRVRALAHGIEERVERGRRRDRVPVYVLRVASQVIRQWARDRCPQQAASLAFQTVLSIVPLLAVGLALMRATGSLDAESSLVEYLAAELIPVSREVLAENLLAWSENVTFQSLGLVGLVSTLLLAFVMVNSLEKTTNFIWRAERKRSMTQKFVVFYATITIGPALMGMSLYQATKFGLTEGWTGFALSFSTAFGALFLANYYLPVPRVRALPAVAGAVFSTVAFEVAKHGFNLYVSHFAYSRLAGIYGALAVLPLWLIWVYYSWLMFLLGVEIAHSAQNLHLLQRIDRRNPMSLENEMLQRINGTVAARVMAAICAQYARGDKATSRRALEDGFGLSSDVVERIAERLIQRDLIIEVEGRHSGFLPARPPSEIALGEVLAAFRGGDVAMRARGHTQLDEVLAEIDEGARSRAGSLSFEALTRDTPDFE